jgi:hypothetical protein
MKLEFPEGAKVGDILLVTYDHPSCVGVVEIGTWDGRLLGIKDHRLTVHFDYGFYDPPQETLVVNLETGMDEKYHVPISDIQLKGVGSPL